MLNDHKQRTETSGASTDSVCRSLFLATRMAREIFGTSKSRELPVGSFILHFTVLDGIPSEDGCVILIGLGLYI